MNILSHGARHKPLIFFILIMCRSRARDWGPDLPMENHKLECCNIRIYHECEGRIEKSIRRIAVWHHQACGVMTNGDPEGWIFLYNPHTNYGFFFLLTTVSLLENKFQEVLRCNFTWWRHLNITLKSLDDNVREFQYNQCMKASHDSLGKIAWVR